MTARDNSRRVTALDNSRRVTARDNSRRVTARDNSRPWQLASLVLIERTAHVRGGCTPGESRHWAAAERRACANH